MDPNLRPIFESNGDPAVMEQSAQNYRNSPSGRLFDMQAQAAIARLQPSTPEQQAQARQGPFKDFPANHPDRPLYDALGPHLPKGTSPEMAAKVVLEAKQNGIHRPDQIDQVLVGNNQVFVAGASWFWAVCARAPAQKS